MTDLIFTGSGGTNIRWRIDIDLVSATHSGFFTVMAIVVGPATSASMQSIFAKYNLLTYNIAQVKALASSNGLTLTAYPLGLQGANSFVLAAPLPTLAAPGSFTATAESTTQINLTWAAVTHATQYTVDRSTTIGFNTGTVTFGIYSGGLLLFNDTALTANTQYYYRISAVASGYNNSPYSTANATTEMVTLATPTDFVATPTGNTTVGLTWAAVANATAYVVDRATNSGFTTGVTLGIYNGATLSFGDTGLTASTEYFYRIKATATGYTNSGYGTANATTT